MPEGLNIGTLTGSIELEDLLTPAMDVVRKSVEQGVAAIEEYAGGIGVAFTAAAGVTIAAFSAISAAIIHLGEEGSKIQGVEDAFDRMALAAGSTGDVFRESLSEGVKGTVSSFELMQTLSRSMAGGVKYTADQLTLLGEASRAMGKATGTDAAHCTLQR